MKTKVYFRVDVLQGMGRGHLVRSLALAKVLKEDFECIFLIKENIVKDVKLHGFDTIEIPSDQQLEEEAKWLATYKLSGNEILVLDGYHFDSQYQKILKEKVGKLVAIDDMHQQHFVVDAIINHAAGIKASDYSCDPECEIFIGFSYLMLRPDFFKNPKKEKQIEIKEIMICFGGEDANNETLNALQQCEKIVGIEKCSVILGSGYVHQEVLNGFCEDSHLDIQIFQNINASEMAGIMMESDTAICSPSTIALEYLSIGGNLFLQQTADNQENIYQYLTKEALAFPLSQMGIINNTQLQTALDLQKNIIDGNSPYRLLKIFRQLENRIFTNIRKATENDMFQYFLWVNEKATRLNSFNSDYVSYFAHHDWYYKKIKEADTHMYILEYKGEPAGQIRFSIDGKEACISYSLDAKFRGRGLSKTLINGGVASLSQEAPSINSIIGYVKKGNTPSIMAFKKMGFMEYVENQASLKFQQHLKRA